jgi:lipopolysaccharide assembly protein A
MGTTERPDKRERLSVREFLRRRWLAIVLVIVAVIFILQNRSQASVSLFNLNIVMALWLILAIVFIVGLLAGFLLSRRRHRRT